MRTFISKLPNGEILNVITSTEDKITQIAGTELIDITDSPMVKDILLNKDCYHIFRGEIKEKNQKDKDLILENKKILKAVDPLDKILLEINTINNRLNNIENKIKSK